LFVFFVLMKEKEKKMKENTDFTLDSFLGGKVILKQKNDGYRATSDAVLLSAAVRLDGLKGRNFCVLDVGCGTGAVGLCLDRRAKEAGKTLHLTGFELQEELLSQCVENARMNNTDFEAVLGDVLAPPACFKGRLFDYVVTNPPYFMEDPSCPDKIIGRTRKEQAPLKEWLSFCLKHLRAKGIFTMIHCTSRLPEILSFLNGKLGNITVLPLVPREKESSKRFILSGVNGSKAPFRLLSPMPLHRDDSSQRSVEADDVLRNGKALDLSLQTRLKNK
jgi:tRNA1Val (adenine37-N6)-methyltransferase